jgi:hypothetical protein
LIFGRVFSGALMGESQAQEKAYVKRPATPMTGR